MAIKVGGTVVIDDSRVFSNLGTALAVNVGGTGNATLTANNIIIGNGTSAVANTNLLTKIHANTTGATAGTGEYIKSIGYADTVVALGNSGATMNIDCYTGAVFTATLSQNCTFTLRYPVSSGATSFTLILTNTFASNTVAWAGGSFKFPGGAASLSRTTTANAIDVWVFFSPDSGVTWYGNIAMKNLVA